MASDDSNLSRPSQFLVETTKDALICFEAARRGMIPRITRRLVEKERSMIRSGAVFVFDEGESGIKRWTDGLIWSPSRILSNFLIYRETETRGERGTPVGRPQHSRPSTAPNSPQSSSSSLPPQAGPSSYGRRASLADDGASSSDGPSEERRRAAEKARERQLVGSLTTSYKFKEGGLVKKTISVTIHGVAQHLISYYSVEDAKSGRLRSPSTLPELSALEISPDYLQAKHFRFPPKTEIGPDGVLRYRGEPDEPTSPIPGIVPLSSVPLPPARPRTGSRSNAPGDGGRPSSSSASRPRKSSLALQPPPASQFRPPPSPQGWEPGPNVGWGAPTQHSPSFFDPGAPRDSMYPDGVSALNGHPLPTPPFASPWMADTRDSTTGGASYTHPSHHGGHHSGQSSPHFQPSPTFHDEQLYRPDIPTRSFSVNFGEPGVAAVQPIAITERPVLERQASLGNLAAGSFPTSNSSRGSYSSRGLRMYHPYSGAGGDSDNGPASAGSVPNAHSGWPDWQRPSSRARGSGPSSNAGSGSPHVSPLVISGAQLVPSAMNDGPFGPPGSAGPTDDYSFLAYQQQHQQQPHHQPTAQPPSHSPGYPPSSHNGGPPQLVYPTTHSSYSPAVSPQNTYALPPPPPTYATPHLDPRPSLTTRASISGSHCTPPIDLSRQRYPSEPYPPTTPAFGDNRAAAASASTSTASTMTPPLTSSSTPAMPFVPPSIGAAVRNSGGGSESSSANGFISMYHESASNDVSMRRRSGVDPLLPREGGLASTTGTNATTSAAAAGGESGADQQAGSKDAGEKQQDGQQPRQPTTSNFGWSFGPSN